MAEEPPAPPPAPTFLDEKIAVERIQAIVGNARTVWFALIAFLAFIGATLVSVRDLDFFSATATTQFPIVNIAIPTTTFFWCAAWLAAVLHTYFHLYLLKLWDVLAEAPPEIGGAPLGDRVFPWLVVDWALRRRPDRPITRRPMDGLANLVTWLVIWLATPLLLAAFWWRSMSAHEAWLTLLIAAALFPSLYATLSGWLRAKERFAQPVFRRRDESAFEVAQALPTAWRHRGTFLALILVLVSLNRTQLETQVAIGPLRLDLALLLRSSLGGLTITSADGSSLASILRWSSLAPIDLVGAEIVAKPADWVGRDTAERRFRTSWCRDRQIPADACERPTEPYHTAARETWCGGRSIEDCPVEFRRLEAAFNQEWQEQRREYLATLTKPDLRGRDLRGANAAGAFLAGIDLSEARLEGADLSEARLEEANFFQARLEDANLLYARLEEANLVLARLDRAHLAEARLDDVNLYGARLNSAYLGRARLDRAYLHWAILDGARLMDARLNGANLQVARLYGADLSKAQLNGANLNAARLQGANLSGAEFKSAYWAYAILGASLAHSADFTGGRSLTQTQLALVIGDANTILPRDTETGEQLHPLFPI